MKKELMEIRTKVEFLMEKIKEHDDFEVWTLEQLDESIYARIEMANYINDWAFNSCQSGKLPWAIARLVQVDAIDNKMNLDTWMSINNILLNADILLG